jgi:hypothetical protein
MDGRHHQLSVVAIAPYNKFDVALFKCISKRLLRLGNYRLALIAVRICITSAVKVATSSRAHVWM